MPDRVVDLGQIEPDELRLLSLLDGELLEAGFRVAADLRNEKITYKIREHSIQKLPYQLVLGDKEVAARTVSARTRAGENLAPVPLEAFISRLKSETQART